MEVFSGEELEKENFSRNPELATESTSPSPGVGMPVLPLKPEEKDFNDIFQRV